MNIKAIDTSNLPEKPLNWGQRLLIRLTKDTWTHIQIESYGCWGFFLRQLGDLIPYEVQHWWTNHIHTIYVPQHSNLRAAIPKTWCDLDGCIESFLFACVIDFVEKEKGLEDWEVEYQEGSRKEQASMLREVYNWAKVGRQAAEDAMFAAAPKHDLRKSIWETLNGDYTEYQRIQDEMEAKTQRYLLWIVENRRIMWT